MTSRRVFDVHSHALPATHRFQASTLRTEASLPDLISTARRVLMRARRGALATISPAGTPLGTILAFALDEVHAPYFALHDWSDHAQHLAGDERCSLLVVDPERSSSGSGPVAATKVTLVGRAHLIAGDIAAAARAALHAPEGHRIYRLAVSRMRVAAAGRSAWISTQPAAQRADAAI
jgi:hypothetical protein